MARLVAHAGGVRPAVRDHLARERAACVLYLVTDRPIAAHLVRSSSKPFAISKTLAPGAEWYVAATQNGHPELVAAVNKALDDLARSGRLALVQRRWL